MDTIGNLRGRPVSVATFASAEHTAERDGEDEVAALFDALAQMTGETDLYMLAKHLIFAAKAQQLAGFSHAEVEARRNALQRELQDLDDELERYILAGAANVTKRAHIDEIERRLKRAHARLSARVDAVQRLTRMLAPVSMGMEIVSRKLAGLHLPPTSAHSLKLRIARSLAAFSKITSSAAAAAEASDASAAAAAAAQAEAEAEARSVALESAVFSAAHGGPPALPAPASPSALAAAGGPSSPTQAAAADANAASAANAAAAMPVPWAGETGGADLKPENSGVSVSPSVAAVVSAEKAKMTHEADVMVRKSFRQRCHRYQ